MKTILILSLIAVSAFSFNLRFNPVECIKDATAVVKSVETFINDAKNKKDISSLISDVETIINGVETMLPECGVKVPTVETKLGDLSQCLSDIQNLVKDAETFVADVKNKAVENIINDAIAIYQLGKQTIEDCKSDIPALGLPSFNVLKCLEDAAHVGKDVEQLISDYNAGKGVSDLIADVEAAVNDIQSMLPECGVKETQPEEEIVGDFQSCLQDIEQVVQIAEKLDADVKAKDISSIISDAESFISTAKQAIADCKTEIPALSLPEFNVLKCLEDAGHVASDVEQLINDYNAGKGVSDLIADVETAVNDIQTMLPDCGVSEEQPEEEIVGDFQNCLQDIEQLVQIAEKLDADVKAKDISSIISDAESFITTGKQAIADCKAGNDEEEEAVEFNVLKCLEDAGKVASDLETLINDYNAGKGVSDLIADVEAAVNDIQTMLPDCGVSVSQFEMFGGEEIVGDFSSCLSDIEAIVQVAQQLVADIKNKDISSLISDAETFINDAKQTIADCKAGEEMTGLTSTESVDINIIQCVKDAVATVDQVKQLVEDIKSKKSISGIISDIEGIYNEIQTLAGDCGLKMELFDEMINDPTYADFATCIKDIEDLAKTFQQLVADVKAKDISSVINDIQAVIGIVKSVETDCKVSEESSVAVVEQDKDVLSCMKDALETLKLLVVFLDDVKGGKDIPSLITDVENIVQEIKIMLPDCGDKSILIFDDQNDSQVGDSSQCEQDIETLAATAQKLMSDIKAADISSIISDAQAFVTEAQAAEADC